MKTENKLTARFLKNEPGGAGWMEIFVVIASDQ